MATIQFPNKGEGRLGVGRIANARVISVTVDMANDVTMGSATDDIVVADLPVGTVVLAAGIEQLVAGTGSGTLVARVGTTTMSGTVASTAAAGTVSAAASVDTTVVTTAATLNVLGATAARTDGKIRVWAVVVEGALEPAYATIAARDTTA